jgi:beta-glucanase (GH16 family)
MLGNSINTVEWPECGEIDIMEHVGFEKDSIFGTVHTKSYNHVIGTQKTKKAFIKDPYGSFHVYSIEWTPEKMDFLLDGKVFNHFTNEHKSVAEWPFDSPFYLVLNIAVGGNLGGMKGLDENVFPATMEVDYVRVYSNQ